MTIGIAIPVGRKDVIYLPRILDSLAESTVPPSQVSLSISGISKYQLPKNYDFEIIISQVSYNLGAAANRNIAANNLSTDIISFIDADDITHIQRNEFIMEALQSSEVVVHDYQKSSFPNYDFSRNRYENSTILKNYLDLVVDSHIYPTSTQGHLDFTCGHVSVKKSIFESFKFDETKYFTEDAYYLRNLVLQNIFPTLITNKLSNYIKHGF